MRQLVVTRTCCVAALVVGSACSEAPPPKSANVPPAAAAPSPSDTPAPLIDTVPTQIDTVLGRCGVVLRPPSEEEREVIDALRTAYGLERSLNTRTILDTISRVEVLAHYRTGFGEVMAEELTNYSLVGGNRLRGTDPALAVPDSVGVLELKRDRARVAWIAPTSFRQQWNAPRCFVDRMVRKDGSWIIEGREQ